MALVVTVSFRQSELGELLKCGLRYYFGVVQGRPRQPTSSLLAGTALHYAAQDLIDLKQSGTELAELQELGYLEDLFASSWKRAKLKQLEEAPEGVDIRWDDDEDKCIAQTYPMVEHFAHEVLPGLQPVATEVRFSELEVVEGVQVEGTIDLIEAGNRLRDWKTSKRAWQKGDCENNIQALMYSLAYRELFHTLPEEFYFYVYVKGYEPRLEIYDATPTERQVESFRWALTQYAQQVEQGVFPPNPNGWWCSQRWCAYWDDCPLGSGTVTTLSTSPPASQGQNHFHQDAEGIDLWDRTKEQEAMES